MKIEMKEGVRLRKNLKEEVEKVSSQIYREASPVAWSEIGKFL